MENKKLIWLGIFWIVAWVALASGFLALTGCTGCTLSHGQLQQLNNQPEPKLSKESIELRDSLVDGIVSVGVEKWRKYASDCFVYWSDSIMICDDGVHVGFGMDNKIRLTKSQTKRIQEFFKEVSEYFSEINVENRKIRKVIEKHEIFIGL